jgi:putative ABC transport system permease protein
MFKFAIKSLFARKLRLLLTSIAIILGVSFVVSSFVIADSLRSTFDTLVEDIQGNTDLTVRTKQDFGADQDRPPVDAAILSQIQAVDGVRAAEGNLSAEGITPIKPDGKPLNSVGPPLLGGNYGTDQKLNQLIQIEGRLPTGPTEFDMDVDTARDHDFVVGQTYSVSSPVKGNRQFTLVGLVAFNSEDNDLVGAVLTIYDTPTAQDFFGREGKFDSISISLEDGAQASTVMSRITDVLPANDEVIDRATSVSEAKDDFGQIADIFGNVLLAFALITVVVSAFIINNTFQIVIGQRIRELALLRALGATGKQVSRSVLVEAVAIGTFATIVGLGVGVLFSLLLRGVFDAIGFSLPSGPLELRPRTIIAAIVIGLGVTVLSSLAPARKARRVPPIAALREDFQLARTGLRKRLIVGGIVTVIGVLLMANGLFVDHDTAPLLLNLAAGALFVFVGVNLLSPIVARPVAKALGTPIQGVYGTTGRLARENAARNPRRTSSTAAALMIGLALVTMAAVVGDSLKKSFLETLDSAVEADFFIQPRSNTNGTAGITPAYSQELAAQPEIDSVEPYRFATSGIKILGDTKDVNGTDFALLPRHIDIDLLSGDVADAAPNSILVHKDSAKDLGLKVGDTLDVTFVDQQTETLTVAAIYGDSSILGNWVIDLDTWQKHFSRDQDQFVTAKTKDGVTEAQAEAAVDRVTANYPQVKAETRAEFKQSQQQQLDAFLAVIQGFVGFALFIALMGIANTLALSVFERTRELGLLRAVGMSRRQMRRMVRWEAAIVAVFGAILGVALGILFGIAAASAVPNSIIKSISIPVGSIVVYIVLAALAGLLAAFFPARRAGKLNVLDAIATN